MKRSIRTVLATSAALALTGIGVAPATATEPKKPAPAPFEKIDDRYTYPAGTACKDSINIHERYKYRITVLKENAKKAYLREEIEDGRAKFHNPKTGKTVKIRLEDRAYIKENRTNATATINVKGEGYLQGPGIYGIVYYKGKVAGAVTGLDDPENKLEYELRQVHGKYSQLCYKLGSKPVVGKLVLPPSLSS